MASLSYTDSINNLRSDYRAENVQYRKKKLAIRSSETFHNEGFLGSRKKVSILSKQSIIFDAPAAIAAPCLEIAAKNAIYIGLPGKEASSCSVRIYAPKELCLVAEHVSIGAIKILKNPELGCVMCKKLTLQKSKEEETDTFEMIQSWLVENQNTEVEIFS